MATYRYVAYSVLQSIKESKDDSDLKRNTIIFWIQVIANQLRQERLKKRRIQSGEFLAHIGNIQVNIEGVRKYVNMPDIIVDLEHDNGIHQVSYYLDDYDYCDSAMSVPFEKTQPAKMWSLLAIGIRKPKPTAPKMAREGSKLYLYGIEKINVQSIDMWIYTAIDPVHLVDVDAEIPIAEDQVVVLINKVMGMARFSMLLPNDRGNTGADQNPGLATNKTALSQAPTYSQDNQQQQSTE